MSYSTPLVSSVTAFDATEAYRYPFSYTGTQYTHINCVIATNAASLVNVINSIVETYGDYYSIVANALTNGTEYTIKIRVGDGTNWSAWSSSVVFSCFSAGVAIVSNVSNNGTVASQNFTFTGTYTPGQTDTLRSHRFILYNASGVAIDTQAEVFSANISYTVLGLINNTEYYIELKCVSNSGMESTSGRIKFTTAYTQPTMASVIEAQNEPDHGWVKIAMNLVQRSGTSSGTTYEDNEWAVVTSTGSYVSFVDGLTDIVNDFSITVWAKGVEANNTLVTISGAYGIITLSYSGSNFIARKTAVDGLITSNYVSDAIVVSNTDEVTVRLIIINNAIEVEAEVYSA